MTEKKSTEGSRSKPGEVRDLEPQADPKGGFLKVTLEDVLVSQLAPPPTDRKVAK